MEPKPKREPIPKEIPNKPIPINGLLKLGPPIT